jgi:hypothetical protein
MIYFHTKFHIWRYIDSHDIYITLKMKQALFWKRPEMRQQKLHISWRPIDT